MRFNTAFAVILMCASAAFGETIKADAGSYMLGLPEGAKGPPSEVFKTDNIKGPLPTNDWWSSLLWVKHSERQFAHPLALRAQPQGMRIFYPGPSISAGKSAIMAGMPDGGADLILGHSAVAQFPDTRLHAHSDWFVTASFASDASRMLISYGHGSPFVYATFEGGSPTIAFAQAPNVWSGNADSPTLGLTISGRHYALFPPAGSTWTGIGTKSLACDTKGKSYFSLAILPDNTLETLDLFRQYAHAHVTDTKVDWSFDEKTSAVTTRFTFTTNAYEGVTTDTLFTLYPHQWTRSDVDLLGKTYASVRGSMKLAKGTGFITRSIFPGVLPALPNIGGDHDTLRTLVREVSDAKTPPTRDTYWEGKHLGKLASLIPIAEQIGDTESAGKMTDELKRRLEGWFSATDSAGQPKKSGLFCYEKTWGTLIGYPASYGSEDQLNDHHFHYGYFIKAAAEIARRDRAWADRYAGFIQILVRDIASPDRADPLFPFLRNFDPYAGHSWASGHARFGDGNNNESSSEAMNAWTALILWGQFTNDRATRDLGIWLYTTEMEAIHNYWFDSFGRNRPNEYQPAVVTMVWGGKSVNETWFGNQPERVHTINWLPLHGGSLYLGRVPEYAARNYQSMVKAKNGSNWAENACLIWMYRALSDPADAIKQYGAAASRFPLEAGNSKANLVHWLYNFQSLGHVNRTVAADWPMYAVFDKGDTRSYTVYNSGAARPVRFSDGMIFEADTGFSVKQRTLPWQSLFNGKDMTGWKPIGTAIWKAEDGIIVGGQFGDPRKSGLLTTAESFTEFELELDFMIDEHGKYNSGVYLRNIPGRGGRTGYQVNIGRGAAAEYCAGIFTDRWLARGDEEDIIRKKLDWNTLRIVAQRGHIIVDFNGVNVADYIDPAPDEKFLQPGVLGFQTYGADGHAGWVKFRNLRIRPLVPPQ